MTVWVAPGVTRGGKPAVHTDDNCPELARSAAARACRPDDVDHLPACQACTGRGRGRGRGREHEIVTDGGIDTDADASVDEAEYRDSVGDLPDALAFVKPRVARLWVYLRRRDSDVAPTAANIADTFGYSTATVHRDVDALVDRGLAAKVSSIKRGDVRPVMGFRALLPDEPEPGARGRGWERDLVTDGGIDVDGDTGVDRTGAAEPAVETVYVASRGRSGHKTVLHTDPDCPSIGRSGKVHEKPRDVYPDDHSVCKFCDGTARNGATGTGRREGGSKALRNRLLEMDPDDLMGDGGGD